MQLRLVQNIMAEEKTGYYSGQRAGRNWVLLDLVLTQLSIGQLLVWAMLEKSVFIRKVENDKFLIWTQPVAIEPRKVVVYDEEGKVDPASWEELIRRLR